MKRFLTILIVSALFVPFASRPSAAQSSPGFTVWRMIGIPDGWRKLRGARINRRGNNPQREKAPPLKALNDPANLEEGTPEIIKKAAEVKMAEDAKKQKIKAIKYLTSIGCACYDTDDSITKALIGASDDCTEEVRLATLQAVKEAAEKQCCANCGTTCCCKEELVMRLAEMAYERDDTGCYLEPSERVREAAKEALMTCCPDTGPVVEAESDLPKPRETAPEDDVIRETDDGIDPSDAELLEDNIAPDTGDDATVRSSRRLPTVQGVVMELDRELRIAHVHFENSQTKYPIGTKLMAVVQRQGQLANSVRWVKRMTHVAPVVSAIPERQVRSTRRTAFNHNRPSDETLAPIAHAP
jgi:hypothetical protein